MGMFDTDDDDDEYGDASPQRSNDNNAMRQLRKALKEAQANNKELADRLAELSKTNRSRSISDVLASKGLSNPKIANLIPESVEASTEAVSAWLDEYADVFTPAPADAQGAPSNDGAPVLPAADVNALRDIDAVSMGGITAQGAQDLLSRINGANNMDELNAILQGAAG